MTFPYRRTQFSALDQYYTRPETAALCLDHFYAALPELSADLFIEPSAGDGVFLSILPMPRIGLDIAPAAEGIETADFLTWTPPEVAGPIAVIGNPPFGRNAALAVDFFNRAAEAADVIAMILPASFGKASMQTRLDRRFHLVSEMPLPAEPFRHAGTLHRVNVTFQVWERRDYERTLPTCQTTHEDFVFVRSLAEADLVIRRVGVRAGAVLPVPTGPEVPLGYCPSSNLYIRATDGDPARLEARFRSLDFSDVRQCVAANPSVSKSEIVAHYAAQRALDDIRDASASNAVQMVSHPMTAPASAATGLTAIDEALEGDLVAMIVSRQGGAGAMGAASLEVTFRRRAGTGFAAVLLGALSGTQRRRAMGLLEELFQGREPWVPPGGAETHVTVLFRDAVLQVAQRGENRRVAQLSLRDTGTSEAAVLSRSSRCMALGRLWVDGSLFSP